jgi:two-component system CheB/CheR fusion protein
LAHLQDITPQAEETADLRAEVTDLRTELERASRESDESLRRSEARFRTLIGALPQLVWCARDDGAWTWCSPQWTAHTGLSSDRSLGYGWLAAVHPDDRQRARYALWGAEPLPLSAEWRLLGPDSRYRWFRVRASLLETAGPREWLGTCTDVDDMRGLQDRQRLLLSELQHRVRNILSVVRAISRGTAETATDVDDFAAHLDGRIGALARSHALLNDPSGAGVDLESIIREESLVYTGADGQMSWRGPEVRLGDKAAETLALAVHELATNAVKYGGLSTPSGRVTVEWAREGDSLLLDWREGGVSLATLAPRRRGFGAELIERLVPYELGGESRLSFQPGGVRCAMRIPLSKRNFLTEPSLLD